MSRELLEATLRIRPRYSIAFKHSWMHPELKYFLENISHIPNILIFKDFEDLIALSNYSEFSLVVNRSRYGSSSPVSFKKPLPVSSTSCLMNAVEQFAAGWKQILYSS